MNDRTIAVMALILFFIGFFVVGAVQSFIETRRRRREDAIKRRRAEFVRNFKKDVVPFKGTEVANEHM